jgi:acetyl-CoA acetyltransferase
MAAIAARHHFEFGSTPEQLAGVAVASRYNASLNPDALYQERLDIDAVMGSPMMSTPLTRLMCSSLDDGAAALILTTEDRARDLPVKPVFVAGTGSAFAGRTVSRVIRSSYREAASVAAAQAFREAGVTPADIDFAEWSDPTAVSTVLALEDYRFCEPGSGGEFVGTGESIRVSGAFPVNTYGGWLSGSFACGSHGSLVEAVRQLQGRCGDRQVANARLAFHAAIGGAHSEHSVAILTSS